MFFIIIWQIRYKEKELKCVDFTDEAENLEEPFYTSRKLGDLRIIGQCIQELAVWRSAMKIDYLRKFYELQNPLTIYHYRKYLLS